MTKIKKKINQNHLNHSQLFSNLILNSIQKIIIIQNNNKNNNQKKKWITQQGYNNLLNVLVLLFIVNVLIQ